MSATHQGLQDAVARFPHGPQLVDLGRLLVAAADRDQLHGLIGLCARLRLGLHDDMFPQEHLRHVVLAHLWEVLDQALPREALPWPTQQPLYDALQTK